MLSVYVIHKDLLARTYLKLYGAHIITYTADNRQRITLLKVALLENELNSFCVWEEAEYALSVSTIVCLPVFIVLWFSSHFNSNSVKCKPVIALNYKYSNMNKKKYVVELCPRKIFATLDVM